MPTRIAVTSREEEIMVAEPDAQGIWRSRGTGRTRRVYDIYIDGQRYATTPHRAEAERIADERAFVSDLGRGNAAAIGALALWLQSEEE